MCLTGVDYFSTLGYQPGIAFLAAGMLSPLATLVLIALTLFGALPIYRKVASESPNGQGSIAMLQQLVGGWSGKLLVLCLLGFAATDFMITMTLSAADAAAHVVENPLVPYFLHSKMGATLFLLFMLGLVFLKGFREAIGISVVLVGLYLVLNTVVIIGGLSHLFQQPQLLSQWQHALMSQHSSPLAMFGACLILFPRLALGLSGFETGVAVMPLVKGDKSDTYQSPIGRIKHTKWLLTLAAIIMSIFLFTSSMVTTLLIPENLFQPGGIANGRALAYLAHLYFGSGFGTFYDISTIAILWFAGASAMAGLLTLVPRYLPRYGMAPSWAYAIRPLVVFFSIIGFVITVIFNADVDAQGGAYATGVLVLITSAALAVTISVWRSHVFERIYFLLVFLTFVYTTIANIIGRPEGIRIAFFFIATIIVTSFISRALRATELRISEVVLDEQAKNFIEEADKTTVRIVAHRPGGTDYENKEREAHRTHNIDGSLIFLEVHLQDASEFTEDVLEVKGVLKDRFKVLICHSPAVPNAIAALLLHIRSKTKHRPHVYFGWTEGNPLMYVLKYIFWGEGETAPVTREVLRAAEQNPEKRPFVHVA